METIKINPIGVCAKEMTIEIKNDLIKSYNVIGGCPGNSQGVAALLKDMPVEEAIKRLSGIKCGFKNTSCPNEIAKGLINYKAKQYQKEEEKEAIN